MIYFVYCLTSSVTKMASRRSTLNQNTPNWKRIQCKRLISEFSRKTPCLCEMPATKDQYHRDSCIWKLLAFGSVI